MAKLTDDDKMPFGKHKGTAMKSVPAQYLLWLYGEMEAKKQSQGPVYGYIKENLKVLEKEVEEEEG